MTRRWLGSSTTAETAADAVDSELPRDRPEAEPCILKNPRSPRENLC